MRIAVLEPYIGGIGGAQRVIMKYASYLQSKGHNVEIFTQRYDKKNSYEDFKKIKINEISLKSKIFLPFIFLFKKFNTDIVIANDWPTNFASIRNKNVLWICYSPKRDIYSLREYSLKNYPFYQNIKVIAKSIFLKKIDQISADKAKVIASISKNIQKKVRMYYKRDSEIFYLGIDFNDYKQGKYKDYVLCVSRLVKPKRVDLVVKSMGLVNNKKIRLCIVGAGPDEKEIKDLAKKYANVEFLGQVEDKKLLDLYSNCLAVIYTPIDEDWGLVPLEAGASGKPTIGSDEGGLKETIVNGKTGFLLDNVSPKSIAEKINYLAKNKKIAKKMGIEARKRAKKFDWNYLLPKIEKLIEYVKH